MAIGSTGKALIGIGALLVVLNTVFVGLRLYTRVAIARTFKPNDGLLLTAWAAFGALYGLAIMGVLGGIGGSLADAFSNGTSGITQALKALFFLEIIYVVLTSAMKGSIAMTFIHLSRSKVLNTLFWTSIGMDVAISLAFIIYLLVQCKPIDKAWNLLDPSVKGECLPLVGQLYMGYALSIVTAILDILLMVSPFIMMRGRGLNSRLKMYIYGIFGLGILATIANVIRLIALIKLKGSDDQLLDAAPVFTWSAIEVSIGIIIAGLIELGPLAAKYGVKGFESFAPSKPISDDYEMSTGKL
ncbi:unnamed protein product [Colletotrichum noveboracense]|uniref:Rhodopsin domain-containing protein n=1 Tax=Colletotrichum noveboracense TaxID=2664923 RepID=A0A9W4WP82_9PEZI|nr:hypothetical protein K456DRAFT_1939831 [Colletotrichum gloeosporioides 23]KAJ0268986.1 hypothetical protein COL940_012878 [Colletotrichum noveboracense]KAJ0272549.1 hypothetical protein CBS470a_012635 [Colletotrichum nupharicola]CAI0652186.1 unnamed protein product [Colletotrichum noveboracense]